MPPSTTAASDQRTQTTAPRTKSLTALQVTAVLSLVSLAFQFVSAGELLSNQASPDVHGAGAIVLHVVTGLTVLAAALHWRRRHTTVWPTVVAGLVFLCSFVQALLGDSGVLWAHVPGALVLTVGAVWVAAWSFGRGARR